MSAFVSMIVGQMGLVVGNCSERSLGPFGRDRVVCLMTDKDFVTFANEWNGWSRRYLQRFGGSLLVDWTPLERVSAYSLMYKFGNKALTVWHTRIVSGRYEVIIASSA
jgi:hypothetical protein